MSSEPYVCTLDEATQKKALEELNEDPKNRQGAIDTLRTWILQQKHFKCPTDNIFLLAFLRARKFSQLEARRLLENFLRRRQKLSEWFLDMDTTAAHVQRSLDTRFFLILPGRDKEGRKVFIMRPGYIDITSKNFNKLDVFRTIMMLFDSLYLCDEMNQVHGTVSLLDLNKMSMAHQTKVSIEDRKNMLQTWQKNYPARIKQIHMYNTGPFMDFVMMIVKLGMSEKVQKRLIQHGHNLEGVYKHLSREMLPEEYLEDDYEGPCAGSEQSIVENMKAELAKPELRDRLKYMSSGEFFINMKEKDTEAPEASFRKLNVD